MNQSQINSSRFNDRMNIEPNNFIIPNDPNMIHKPIMDEKPKSLENSMEMLQNQRRETVPDIPISHMGCLIMLCHNIIIHKCHNKCLKCNILTSYVTNASTTNATSTIYRNNHLHYNHLLIIKMLQALM